MAAIALNSAAFAIRARSAQDQVVHDLATAILRGDFPEGSILPAEAEMVERFAVSRTVLREAMKTLAAKGLLISKTKVGTRIRDHVDWNMFDPDVLAWRLEIGLDRRFLESLYEIRLAVEPAAAALAAIRRSDADVVRLRSLIDDISRPGHDRSSFALADLALHLEIGAVSGNPFMRSLSSIIEAALMATFTRMSPTEDPRRLAFVANNHAAIVDAIAQRNSAAAALAMKTVIEDGMRDRMTFLLQQNKEMHMKGDRIARAGRVLK